MITTFKDKDLAEFWEKGTSKKIDQRVHARLKRRLSTLHAATKPDDLDQPWFDFHALQGKPKRYTIHVNGPWCITFEFEDGEALAVKFEQYH